ncbi:MAG: aminomethyltransferase family protein [Betaproteobacteria bacterium]
MVTTEFAGFLAGRSAATLSISPCITVPQYFSDAADEHLATRRAAGLFDFSFMYCVEIAGAGSRDFLHALQTRTVDALARGRIAYTLLLRDDGSVLIDATVWRHDDECYWLFTGRRGDADYIAQAARGYALKLNDRSTLQAVIAIQGPSSTRILGRTLGDGGIHALRYFEFKKIVFAQRDCWVARIGYSGELGYELVIADAAAPRLWGALHAAGQGDGLRECGFAAADSLRIEAGHVLFTRELAAAATPAELGLTRLMDFSRTGYRGAAAVRAQRWREPPRRLVGLLPISRANQVAGPTNDNAHITSRSWSPVFARELALGFVPSDCAYPGTRVTLAGGERAEVARLPFYDPARRLPRRAP